MNPNVTVPNPSAEPTGAKAEVLPPDADGQRWLDDRRWMHKQHQLGAFNEYYGEYVGVYAQQVVGHNPSLIQLQADVEREKGIPPTQLATTYVGDPKGFVGGRRWLA